MRGLINLRVLTLDDCDRWMAVWRQAGLHVVRPQGRDSRQAFANQFAAGTHTVLGLDVDGELVGVALATHDGRKGWINRLGVLPEYHHRGYAAHLIAADDRILRGRGMTVIAALIEPENDASLAPFLALGYIEAAGMHYVSKRDSQEA